MVLGILHTICENQTQVASACCTATYSLQLYFEPNARFYPGAGVQYQANVVTADVNCTNGYSLQLRSACS